MDADEAILFNLMLIRKYLAWAFVVVLTFALSVIAALFLIFDNGGLSGNVCLDYPGLC